MALFKCKMCGGSLEVTDGATIIECEYCGTQQTLPKLNDEKRANMYDRANHFRRNNEFDKAMTIYEQILNEDNSDAEAYWSIVLCRYGIEYVEDPSTHRRIPTINRVQFTSILADEDYKSALKYADTYQRSVYELEAKAIDKIQKEILAISNQEEPFDVFICYKESDHNGRRTHDSVLAQELYYGLKNEGFKVFFSRITLESKLGSAYEPYIFAALNSAKVMVVLGTRSEHFNAVWVKNEWSRYLALIKKGEKKMLIPAYKDMDPYDLPDEFSHLQAQDMSKLGFMQDLIRGIKKIIKVGQSQTTVVKETVATNVNTSIAPLLKRAYIFLEGQEWQNADEYAEKVLDMDPECGSAYLVKLLVEMKLSSKKELESYNHTFDHFDGYKKLMRFANKELAEEIEGYNTKIRTEIEQKHHEEIYKVAETFSRFQTSKNQHEAAINFQSIPGYRDSNDRAKECFAKAKELALIERKDEIYNEVRKTLDYKLKFESTYIYIIIEAQKKLKSLGDWRDSAELVKECDKRIVEIKAKIEQRRETQKKRNSIIIITTTVALILCIAFFAFIQPSMRYNKAEQYLADGYYKEAIEFYRALYVNGNYRDSYDKLIECHLRNGDGYTVVNTYGITDVVIPDGVISVDPYAFRGCSSLTSITIPDSVTSIGWYAFSGCTSLTSITIGNSVTSIGSSAFSGCSSLENVYYTGGVAEWLTITFSNLNSNPMYYAENLYFNGEIVTNVTIPDSVTSIGSSAFYNCSSLTSITVPESVTSIADRAFYGCSSLTSITIPDSVTSVGYSAFQDCSSLTSITIPDSVTSVGDRAFYGCSSLTSITIPNSVTSIGGYAFAGCKSLTIYCEAASKPSGWHSIWNPSNHTVVWGYKSK